MDPARIAVRILGLLIVLACIVFCFPVVLILFLILWMTGRLGIARNFVFTRTAFGHPSPHGEPQADSDAIDAEVIEAETIMEKDDPDASGHSQNRLSQ